MRAGPAGYTADPQHVATWCSALHTACCTRHSAQPPHGVASMAPRTYRSLPQGSDKQHPPVGPAAGCRAAAVLAGGGSAVSAAVVPPCASVADNCPPAADRTGHQPGNVLKCLAAAARESPPPRWWCCRLSDTTCATHLQGHILHTVMHCVHPIPGHGGYDVTQ
jgi:hypothetical protein